MDIDTTKPNAGRIYDYMLGGNHNFEADRAAADQLLKFMPSAKNGMLLNRWFMHDVIDRLSEAGFDCFLDLASGLPTQGYVHELVPNAKVLYNDRDPVTVAYGREIIAGLPNVRYNQSNISEIGDILKAADEHFAGQRKVAVMMVGIAYFLPDDVLKNIIDTLYDWLAPGSQMALSWMKINYADPRTEAIQVMYRQMGSPFHDHEHTILPMLERWDLGEQGTIPLTQWVEAPEWYVPDSKDEEIAEVYGMLVTRP
ncbi:MAG TPA: SAM-dependent methyltransferase [Herpetosiphonaceae bacterium]